MNNINIIGTMVKDIELKYLPSGAALGSFSIAVNQDYKKDNQLVKKTSFFDVKVFGKQSETISNFFHKGSRIGINGELDQESWVTQDGQNRSKVVIKLNSFSFIDRKSDNQNHSTNQQQTNQVNHQQRVEPEIQYEDTDEVVPF